MKLRDTNNNEQSRYEISASIKEWVIAQHARLYGPNRAPLTLEEWKAEDNEFQKRVAQNKEYELEYLRCQGRTDQAGALEQHLSEQKAKKTQEIAERVLFGKEFAILKNLLISYEGTLRAMTILEGELWGKSQTRDGNYTVPHALEAIKASIAEEKVGVAVIYGAGGYHRYFVSNDGTVTFSAGHASVEETLKAEQLGFPIAMNVDEDFKVQLIKLRKKSEPQ